VPHDHQIQMIDLEEEHRDVQSVDVKPRNYVSNASVTKLPCSAVISFAISPDKLTLISVDSLEDPKT
jgi:hypothetical protein